MTASLSVNTRHAYATALANFTTFRSNYALPLQWPVPENHIHAYITYLFHNGYAPSTAAMHISAISFQHKINHNFDCTSTFAISKMLEGYKRLRAKSRKENPQKPTQLSSKISSKTSRGKKDSTKDTIIDITSDSQVNSNFPNRWSQASLTFNNYFYLFLYLYIT